MSNPIYSMKQGVTVATLCLISEFSYGLVSCQDGMDYKNSCNPYNIEFKTVAKNSNEDNSHYVAIESNLSKKKIYQSKSYFQTLLERYEKGYDENSGLLALIDRSSYSVLKSKEIDNVSIKPKPKPKPKPIEVVKKDEDVKTQHKSIKYEKEQLASQTTKTEKEIKNTKLANNDLQEIADNKVKDVNFSTTKTYSKYIKDESSVKNANKSSNLIKQDKKENKRSYKFYTVQKGDSLIKIAKKFNIKKSILVSLNFLDKNNTIKIGQKIKLPNDAKLVNVEQKESKQKFTTNNFNDIYIVKKGDTLSLIAKKTRTSITLLREINRLSRSSHIKVGQKIKLKPSILAKRERRSFSFSEDIKFKKVPAVKFKRRIRVTATAYTSHRGQTDKTPFLAAWNNRLRPGMKVIAVSPDLIRKYGLTNGVKVKIMGLSGYYVVRDKMNKKWRNRIDIYMGTNKRRALNWGRRRIVLYW